MKEVDGSPPAGVTELDHLLATCLARIEAGELTLDDALALYPQARADLEPLLGLASDLRQFRQVQAPPMFKQAARERLIAQMRSDLTSRPLIGGSQPVQLSLLDRLFLRPSTRLAGLLTGLALLIGGTTAVQASSQTLPGDVLYPLKGVSESLQVNLAQTDEARFAAYLTIAENRLTETQAIAGQGSPDRVLDLLHRYERTLTDARRIASAAGPRDQPAPDPFERQLAEHQERAVNVLEELVDVVPRPAQPAIEQVLQKQLDRQTAGQPGASPGRGGAGRGADRRAADSAQSSETSLLPAGGPPPANPETGRPVEVESAPAQPVGPEPARGNPETGPPGRGGERAGDRPNRPSEPSQPAAPAETPRGNPGANPGNPGNPNPGNPDGSDRRADSGAAQPGPAQPPAPAEPARGNSPNPGGDQPPGPGANQSPPDSRPQNNPGGPGGPGRGDRPSDPSPTQPVAPSGPVEAPRGNPQPGGPGNRPSAPAQSPAAETPRDQGDQVGSQSSFGGARDRPVNWQGLNQGLNPAQPAGPAQPLRSNPVNPRDGQPGIYRESSRGSERVGNQPSMPSQPPATQQQWGHPGGAGQSGASQAGGSPSSANQPSADQPGASLPSGSQPGGNLSGGGQSGGSQPARANR